MGVDLCRITKPFFQENGLMILKTEDNLRTVSEGCDSYWAVMENNKYAQTYSTVNKPVLSAAPIKH